jgi:uncharacterized protein (TIGR03435 family)
MHNRVLAIIISGVFAGAGMAQTASPAAPATPAAAAPAGKLQFEVATIKPAPPLNPQMIAAGKMHVGANIDEARADFGFMALADLIQYAYKLKQHQLVVPDWAKTERFDILAKMPEGTNKDQVPEMMQALLVERFGLTFHKESREQSVYALVVGKGGSKLKESSKEDEKPPADEKGANTIQMGGAQMRQSGNSVVVTSKNQPGKMTMTMADGKMQFKGTRMKMDGLTELLTRFSGKPVVDMTDLKGEYDIALEVSMSEVMAMAQKMGVGPVGMMGGAPAADSGRPADAATEPTGSVFTSVQAMGLKLEPRKAPVDTIIVDKLEKAPTEN